MLAREKGQIVIQQQACGAGSSASTVQRRRWAWSFSQRMLLDMRSSGFVVNVDADTRGAGDDEDDNEDGGDAAAAAAEHDDDEGGSRRGASGGDSTALPEFPVPTVA